MAMESQQTEEVDKEENDKEILDEIIVLNVGGFRHETKIKTLLSLPNTRLADLAEQAVRSRKREYFFDRHPDFFPYILNFYRIGKLHVPMNFCGPLLKDELEFWKIDDKDIQQCCWVHYVSFEETLEMIDKFERDEFSSKLSLTPVDNNGYCWQRLRPKIWKALQDPYSSRWATAYAVLALVVVLVSISVFVVETLPYFDSLTVHASGKKTNITSDDLRAELDIFNDIVPYDILLLVDNSCNIFFFMEFLVKLYAAPNKKDFLTTPLTIIEAICLIPYYVAVGIIFLHSDPINLFELIRVLFAFRVLRIFRIFILMKHFLALKILIYTIKASTKELALLLLVVLIGMVVFACLEYYMEIFLTDESDFEHIPMAFWWAIVTMTTVGYGDMVPKTGLGYLIGSVCAISGVLVIALSVPAIVNNFSLYYTHAQSRQKLKQRKRKYSQKRWNQIARKQNLASARSRIASAVHGVLQNHTAKEADDHMHVNDSGVWEISVSGTELGSTSAKTDTNCNDYLDRMVVSEKKQGNGEASVMKTVAIKKQLGNNTNHAINGNHSNMKNGETIPTKVKTKVGAVTTLQTNGGVRNNGMKTNRPLRRNSVSPRNS